MAKRSNNDENFTGLGFLLEPPPLPPAGVVAVVGDEAFLKHEVIAALRSGLLGSGDAEVGWRVFAGPQAEWRDVADAVGSRSLFGGGRVVALIEEADQFVTRYRDSLERHAESGAGLVLLDVSTLPGNTRLAKAVAQHGLAVRCSTPDKGSEVAQHRRETITWLRARASAAHGATLDAAAAEALVELLPLSVGMLDQEVARLALLAGESGAISTKLVRENVGGWRVRTAWEMIDAAVDGAAGEAITQLDRLLLAGEQPIGVLAQLGSTLRKFATAAVIVDEAERDGRKVSLADALARAGFLRFKIDDAQRQLRQLGRQRALALAGWVLEADLAMKGHNSQPHRARLELERLLLRLARESAPAR
ncbi:MAG: DNA polymerase III subunit delta [Lacipirellulaceae bacterium]